MLMSVLGSSGYLLLHTRVYNMTHSTLRSSPSSHKADLHVAVFPYSVLPRPPFHCYSHVVRVL